MDTERPPRNETAVDFPDTPLIHELGAAQAEARPGATAAVHGDRRLTYGEPGRRANQLAHALRRIGVGAEQVVGVCLERSPELIVALLGGAEGTWEYPPPSGLCRHGRLIFGARGAGLRWAPERRHRPERPSCLQPRCPPCAHSVW
ncbi:MAG: AMP-binding protein [Mycobacterium leprae]